ncbi:hypothetical protein QN277_020262 [Acacia crassicarpa]|uniref:Endonuclease/exonuclease/phosphatase domain-containing protein n=1 Tax=Acacia crassicarpa TaxID=499986 RepID=A0AAE1JNP6_9FABA|nr:hypothetical protein QN277_020262 [Acacia crassicarpa]
METKNNSLKCKKARVKCGFVNDLYVDPCGLSGALALWWLDSISVSVLYKSKNIIQVYLDSGSLCAPKVVTFVYGPPIEGERREVWNILRRLASGISVSWLVLGDFNDLLSQSEKEGGNPRSMRKILNFQGLLSDYNLLDLEFKGSKFTWCNKRGSSLVRERIDRALGNVEFRTEFDHAMVFHIEPVGSDHHALIVDCCYTEVKTVREFKFEANWVLHVDFLNVVKSSWLVQTVLADDRLLDLIRRLNICRERLVEWSRKEFPNFRKTIDHLCSRLLACYEGPLSQEMLLEAENLVGLIEENWIKEETYWWQRSRISWLKSGDQNTKFFHSSVIQRRQRNKILRLKGEDGCWLEERGAIHDSFNKFYRTLFCAGDPRPMELALSYVKKVVTVEDNMALMRPVTDLEIEDVVFQLGANKAPGPDGLCIVFSVLLEGSE